MATLISIDPGITGAICIWQDGKAPRVEDMPTIRCGKVRRAVNAALLAHILGGIDGPVDVWVEKSWPRPNDGAHQAFRFGENYGVVLGVIAALGYAAYFVTPQQVRQALSDSGIRSEREQIAWIESERTRQSLRARKAKADVEIDKRRGGIVVHAPVFIPKKEMARYLADLN